MATKTEVVARAMASALGMDPDGPMRQTSDMYSVGPAAKAVDHERPAWRYFVDLANVVIAAIDALSEGP